MKLRLLIFALFVSAQALFAQSKSDDWAQYYRYGEANAQITASPDVVFMGNSITDGWAKKRSDFFTENNFEGRGISGQTSAEMLARFQSDVVNLSPKVVVILAGTNDVAQNNGPITLQHAFENIRSMCDIARYNKITPILCSVMPCAVFKWRKEMKPSESIIELNELIKAYAKQQGIEYVDYHSTMRNSEGGLDAELSSDGCHPTLYGYSIMEKIVAPVIQKVMGRAEPYYTPAK